MAPPIAAVVVVRTGDEDAQRAVKECCWFASQVLVVNITPPLPPLPSHVGVCSTVEEARAHVWPECRSHAWEVRGAADGLDGREVRRRLLLLLPGEAPEGVLAEQAGFARLAFPPAPAPLQDRDKDVRVGVVVVACSDEFPFLRASIPELSRFSRDIVVAIGGCLWNGEPEDEIAIEELCAELPAHVGVVRYNPLEAEPSARRRGVREEMFPEALARWTAVQALHDTPCTHVLFLDSDEVLDGRLFGEWMSSAEGAETLRACDAVKFANHWYWRHPTLRARAYVEDSCLLQRREAVRERDVFSDGARTHMYDACPGPKRRRVTGPGGDVMAHHYSWVRDREQMLRKVRNWGHRRDIPDLEAKVNEEFSRPFNGTDFLRGLAYDVVPDRFHIAAG